MEFCAGYLSICSIQHGSLLNMYGKNKPVRILGINNICYEHFMRAREMTHTGKHLLPKCEDQSWRPKSKRVYHRHVNHLVSMPNRHGYPVGIQCLEGRDEGASSSYQLD